MLVKNASVFENNTLLLAFHSDSPERYVDAMFTVFASNRAGLTNAGECARMIDCACSILTLLCVVELLQAIDERAPLESVETLYTGLVSTAPSRCTTTFEGWYLYLALRQFLTLRSVDGVPMNRRDVEIIIYVDNPIRSNNSRDNDIIRIATVDFPIITVSLVCCLLILLSLTLANRPTTR